MRLDRSDGEEPDDTRKPALTRIVPEDLHYWFCRSGYQPAWVFVSIPVPDDRSRNDNNFPAFRTDTEPPGMVGTFAKL